jgi:hypothetical protein
MGASELILVLLALSGFGVKPNPNAPAAAEVVKYAPDNADAMMYFDVEATLPPNYKVFTSLPSSPLLAAASPELRAWLNDIVQHAEGARMMATGSMGVDPVTAIKSVAAWTQLDAKGKQHKLLVVRGSFPPDLADKIIANAHATRETVDGHVFFQISGAEKSMGIVGDTVLMGDADLVKKRLAKGYRPSKATSPRIAALFDDHPFMVLALTPSSGLTKLIQAKAGHDADKALLVDVITGTDVSALSLRATGVSWVLHARSAAGYQRAVDASDGMLALMRSQHLGLRGMARLVVAALPSFSRDPKVAALIKHRADILKLVDDWSGDGMFEAKVDNKTADRSVTVRATGKTLSEVLPLTGLMVPAGAFALLTKGGRKREEPAMMRPTAKPRGIHAH